MANYKIIGGDGQHYGPISEEQLRQWIGEGRLNAQTMVQAEGSDWKPLSSFSEFGLAASGAFVAPSKPPGAIKVFGIINIVFGSLGLLCLPFSLVALSFASKQPGYHPIASPAWLTISSVLGILGSVILLISGIGLCGMKAWARKLAVYYAWFALAFSVVSIFVQLKSGFIASAPEQTKMIGMVSMIFGTLISWTYNGLLIFFLSQSAVKQALGETK